MRRELEIYIHIPFCVRKCAYCDFLSAPAEKETMKQYLSALLAEIAGFPDAEEYEVSTVFFGGGTPSILPAEWISQILDALCRRFRFRGQGAEKNGSEPEMAIVSNGSEPEITLECNPGTADFEKLQIYRQSGINRLSLGLQSANDQELRCLGRIHTWERFLETWQDARRAGFTNINVDLMSALPGQTIASWEETLQKVLALRPEHISAYSLIIEEGTPFYDRYQEDALRRERGESCMILPSEEEERRMYELTEQYLNRAGLYRYEISNYAKPGYECRHNIGYWRRVEYVGFGLGASSLLKETRIQNTSDLGSYLAGERSECQQDPLNEQEQMEEFMYLGLRMTEGVDEREFVGKFHTEIDAVYGAALKKLISRGLLERQAGKVRLTPLGRDLANPVMAEFLL